MSWYVIHTKPNGEKKALANLINQKFTCYMPLYTKEQINKNNIKKTSKPLFPRYIFIEVKQSSIQQNFGLIRSTVGVYQLLKNGENPLKINEDIIKELKNTEKERENKIEKFFKTGESVQIRSGPFKGVKAIFECEDSNERAVLFFELLKKPTKINVDKVKIKKII